MYGLVKKSTEQKFHPDNIKLSKAWNPSTRLLGHFHADRSGKSLEYKHRENNATKKQND
jgi:hypothetical protein